MAYFGLLRSDRAPDPGLKGLILAVLPLTRGKSIEHNEKEVIQPREVGGRLLPPDLPFVCKTAFSNNRFMLSPNWRVNFKRALHATETVLPH